MAGKWGLKHLQTWRKDGAGADFSEARCLVWTRGDEVRRLEMRPPGTLDVSEIEMTSPTYLQS